MGISGKGITAQAGQLIQAGNTGRKLKAKSAKLKAESNRIINDMLLVLCIQL